MIEFRPCPSCTELVVDGACVCPHCGEKACRGGGIGGAALLLGLTLVACGGGKPQPLYGVTTTPTDTADTAEPPATSAVTRSDEGENE